LRRQLASLQAGAGQPDLSALSSGERGMVESACGYDRRMNGPAAYYNCLRRQLASLQAGAGQPDLSALSSGERGMVESACGYDRRMNGPAAYYNCLRRQLASLQAGAGQPDLSALSSEERGMVESACGYDRRMNGPAAYYNCLRRQLASFSQDRTPRSVVETADKDSTPLSETPKVVEAPKVAEAPRVAETHKVAEDIIAVALKEDETQLCQDNLTAECHALFLRSIHYRSVTLTPSGQSGLIVELSAPAFCGSGGCSIYVLRKTSSGYATVLEELGSLDGLQVATAMNNGYYDLTRRGKISASRYIWTGSKYVSSATTDSALDVTNEPLPSPHPSPNPESPSSGGGVAWVLAGFLMIGAFARVLYKRSNLQKCPRCGSLNKAGSEDCTICAAKEAESARRASAQRAAEQRAAEQREWAEEQRYAREQQEKERHRARTLADLHQLTGPQFENLIASLFRKDGYTVRHCGGSGDEGIDLVLVMGQVKDVVQCKRWKSGIGSPVVREFYGALMHAVARHGFIITTASFSESARDFARGKPISLISGAEILGWINGTYSSRDQETTRPYTNSDSKTFDPYAVLGINRNATQEEIRAAYRREMVNYHPDKVAHLGKELRDLAKTKAQEINRAYQELARSQ
jgi:DnaJ-domain-containing protein 1